MQILNLVFLYRPPLGAARSSITGWLTDSNGRLLSVLAGLLGALGDTAQFLSGQSIGYAVRLAFLFLFVLLIDYLHMQRCKL